MNNEENQLLAFNKLNKLRVGALFMDMGSGKTKVALDLINSKIDKVESVLWITNHSLINETIKEMKKWTDINIEVIGCESIGASDNIFLDLFEEYYNKKFFLIIDESLSIKNRDAKRTERIIRLGKRASYKLILNGTPMTKNLLDMWTQMEFLSPKILNMSYNQFKNTYCEYYKNIFCGEMILSHYNVEHLISLIKPYIFDSALEIPSNKHYYQYSYSLTIEEMEKYDNIKQMILNGLEFNFFSISTIAQKFYTSSVNKKILLDEILEDLDQAIIYVKYLDNLPENSTSISGETPIDERSNIIDKFRNNEIKHLYCTYGVGSKGLNLQFCSNIIFADHTFDYAQRLQAENRIYRMGQERDVNYYDLTCNIGLDMMILKCLDKKENLLNEVKKQILKVGEEEWLKSI